MVLQLQWETISTKITFSIQILFNWRFTLYLKNAPLSRRSLKKEWFHKIQSFIKDIHVTPSVQQSVTSRVETYYLESIGLSIEDFSLEKQSQSRSKQFLCKKRFQSRSGNLWSHSFFFFNFQNYISCDGTMCPKKELLTIFSKLSGIKSTKPVRIPHGGPKLSPPNISLKVLFCDNL